MIYHIERKSLGEWSDVCYPTKDEKLARDICYMESSKNGPCNIRVATYDDRDEFPNVITFACSTGWSQE